MSTAELFENYNGLEAVATAYTRLIEVGGEDFAEIALHLSNAPGSNEFASHDEVYNSLKSSYPDITANDQVEQAFRNLGDALFEFNTHNIRNGHPYVLASDLAKNGMVIKFVANENEIHFDLGCVFENPGKTIDQPIEAPLIDCSGSPEVSSSIAPMLGSKSIAR